MKRHEFLFLVLILVLCGFAVFVIAKGGGGGGGSAPPPPCPIQTSGCYRSGNIRANFGELAPSEFSYFLSENKCQRNGNCDCNGASETSATQTEPDASSGACNCIANTAWDNNGKCCGDDIVATNTPATPQNQIYTRNTNGMGRNPTITCDAGDIRIRCQDTGGGRNHGCDPVGENGCHAWEGSGNYGAEGCLIECQKSSTPSQLQTAGIDCGRTVSGSLCSINADTAAWISASSPNVGDIRYVGCAGAEYLSDGANWIKCNNTLWKNTVNNNEFICTGQGRESIVECCGDGTCNSRVDGKKLATGQSIVIPQIGTFLGAVGTINPNNFTNYCRADGKFVTELDTPNPNRADTSLNNKNKKTCENAGFKWTGTKCCSEADDNLSTSTLREFYNDQGTIGGCWNSTFVRSIDFASGTGNSTVNYNGEFHGCAIGRNNLNPNSNLLNFIDRHSGNQLIMNHDYCFNDPGRNIYCSFTGKWILTNGADRTHLSTSPNVAATAPGTSTSGSTSSQTSGTCTASIKAFDYNLITGKPARVRAISNKPGKIEIFAEGLTSQSGIIKIQECGSITSGVTECTYSSGIPLPDSFGDIVVRYYAELTTSSEHVSSDSKVAQIGSQNRNNNNFCTDETHIVLNGGANSQGALCNTPPSSTASSNYCQTGACVREPNVQCTYPSNCQSNDALRTILPLCSGVAPSVPAAPTGSGPTPAIPSECCGQNQCWDGSTCIDDQRSNPQAQPINGFRCIAGNWTQSRLKFSPDRTKSGYCQRDSQCLLDPFGRNESSQCIESSQFVNDNYCENGNWSSRTKILALKLFRLTSGDYTIFCDNRNNALNNLQYLTGSGEIVSDILTNLQTNNFCVLKTPSNVIAATSINRNLGDVPANSLNILGVTNCDSAQIDDDQYHPCDSSNKAWFNKRLNSFIYSSSSISIQQDTNLLASSDELINTPIRTIAGSIRRLVTNPPFDDSYANAIRKFDRIYFTHQGTRTVKGAIEGLNFKNAIIQYSGFGTDICNFVAQFNAARSDAYSGIACRSDGSDYFVLVQGSPITNLNPDSVWPDLTSKLRII